MRQTVILGMMDVREALRMALMPDTGTFGAVPGSGPLDCRARTGVYRGTR